MSFKVFTRLFAIVFVIALLIAPAAIARKCKRAELAEWFGTLGFKSIACICGVRVRTKGQLSDARPLLLVSNHTSYLDVIAFGSAVNVAFTPKSEIEHWPVVGTLCRIIGTVFIERKATRTADNMVRLQSAVQSRRPVLLFAEGTTSDGKQILPFKSSFFALAQGGAMTVQPAVISYMRRAGLPIDSQERSKISWFGDMDLWPHAKEFLQGGALDVEIEFLPPLDSAQYTDRKQLSSACEQAVSQVFQAKLTAR